MEILELEKLLINLSNSELLALFAEVNRKKDEEEKRKMSFPLKRKFYMSSEYHVNYCIGKGFGLTDDQLTHYSRVGHNVEFDIEIDFEGKAVATHVNGIALVEPVEI